ncbi:MAG TPA: clostripain-related cysteine peptidase, partial [Candidatus Wallbacteria bacterium]|nr:clostripain-related cysteine peptidase [Candidatus Wallbacteria bacterium]
ERAAMSKDVNLIVEIDRYKKPARVYSVNERDAAASADDWELKSKKIAELGEVDMGDYKELVRFVNWSVNKYPAENYMVIVWNHGGGWKLKNNRVPFKGISYDDESGNNISTKDLGLAMASIHGILGKPLDIFGMDACLMQMMEVAFEVRENVKYISASEETEPGAGWPYDLFLAPVYKNPAMNPEELVKLIPEAYFQYYLHADTGNGDSPYIMAKKCAARIKRGGGTTQSAVDCSRLNDLASALDELAAAVIEALPSDADVKTALIKAVSHGQKFYYYDNADIGDLIWFIRENTKNVKVKEACQKALMAYKKSVLVSKVTGDAMKDATGMAIYFPMKDFSKAYDSIKFSEKRWDDMVKAFLATKPVFEDNEDPYGGGASDDSDRFVHSAK